MSILCWPYCFILDIIYACGFNYIASTSMTWLWKLWSWYIWHRVVCNRRHEFLSLHEKRERVRHKPVWCNSTIRSKSLSHKRRKSWKLINLKKSNQLLIHWYRVINVDRLAGLKKQASLTNRLYCICVAFLLWDLSCALWNCLGSRLLSYGWMKSTRSCYMPWGRLWIMFKRHNSSHLRACIELFRSMYLMIDSQCTNPRPNRCTLPFSLIPPLL